MMSAIDVSLEIVVARQECDAEVADKHLMNQRAGEQPRRSRNRAPVGDLHLAAPPRPPADGNFQKHQHEPADARGDGQCEQQGQPLP